MRPLLTRALVGAALLAPVAGLGGYLALSGGGGGDDLLPISLASGFTGITYEAGADLPELEGEAPAYELDRPDAGDVRELAAALGLGDDVEVREIDGQEMVVQTDTGTLSVTLFDTSGSWNYSSFGSPAPGDGDAVAAQELVEAAMAVAGYEGDERSLSTAPGGAAFMAPLVDGIAVAGMQWSAAVQSNGELFGASGFLGRPNRIDTFPLVSTGEAIERLNTGQAGGVSGGFASDVGVGRGGIGNAGGVIIDDVGVFEETGVQIEPAVPAGPITTIPTVETIVGQPVPTAVPPPSAEEPPVECDDTGRCAAPGFDPGAPDTTICPPEFCTTVPPDQPPVASNIELVAAELGLAFITGFNSQSYLVPAHHFTGANGEVASAVAVVSDRLAAGFQGGPFPVEGDVVVDLPAPAPQPPLPAPTTGTVVIDE